jgi:hypothetical protein
MSETKIIYVTHSGRKGSCFEVPKDSKYSDKTPLNDVGIKYYIGEWFECDECGKKIHTWEFSRIFQDAKDTFGTLVRNQITRTGLNRMVCPICAEELSQQLGKSAPPPKPANQAAKLMMPGASKKPKFVHPLAKAKAETEAFLKNHAKAQ